MHGAAFSTGRASTNVYYRLHTFSRNNRMNLFSDMQLLRTLRLCTNLGQFVSGITRPISGQYRIRTRTRRFVPSSMAMLSVRNFTSTTCTRTHVVHLQQLLCQSSSLFSRTEAAFLSVQGVCPSSVIRSSRQLSSNPQNIDKDPEDGGSASGQEIEWNHPADRIEDAVSNKDPELLTLLCEIASDFGKSKTAPTDPETGVIDDGPSSDKRTPVENKNSDAGVKDGFVAIATDEEQFEGTSDLNDAEELSTVKPSRNNREIWVVFSIDDIVGILREEGAQDICVISVPPEKNYVDYFIVVTGRSTRHLSAMTQYINKLYKQRKGKADLFLTVEGKFTDDWMCLDFGNIVVHFMLEETRALYDLEELWTLGKDFDDHMQQWEQYETLLFNPETDLQTYSDEGQELEEK